MPGPAVKGATPVGYLAFLPGLVQLCRAEGYNLLVHGSLARDFDLVAIAWTHSAIPIPDLVQKIVEHTGGKLQDDLDCDPFDFTRRSAEPKPHNRWAYTIHLGAGPMIDLSVMGPEFNSVQRLMERVDQSVIEHQGRRVAAGLPARFVQKGNES